MPIVLRRKDGQALTLPEDIAFVELQNAEGKIAALIYRDAQGIVHYCTAQDRELERYLSFFPEKKLESTHIVSTHGSDTP